MTIRLTSVTASAVSKASELNAIANNGIVRIDSPADLADPNLVGVNVVFDTSTFKLHTRRAAGVGADKWSA